MATEGPTVSARPSAPPSGAPRAAPPTEEPHSSRPARSPGPMPRSGTGPAPEVARVATVRPVSPPARPARDVPVPAPRPAGPSSRRRRIPLVIAVVLTVLLVWPLGLLIWANGKIVHVEALSTSPGTPGRTFLLVGSDSRADGSIADGTAGQRSDSMMLIHTAANGRTAMVSMPRDTLIDIPGHGLNKLNAAFSLGGSTLLVESVEALTGLHVDHYIEIGMGGVVEIVDAVGGIELCLDYDVNDERSELVWTAGCHTVDGRTALAFARMRYSDPMGDIGRQARQRQVVTQVIRKAAVPSLVANPRRQVALIDAGTGALATDEDTGIVDLARLALAFRAAGGEDGVTGTPPIADFDYRVNGVGSTVLLDEATAPEFFRRMRDGELTAADFQ